MNGGIKAESCAYSKHGENYRIHGSGVNEAGRNFIVAVNALF